MLLSAVLSVPMCIISTLLKKRTITIRFKTFQLIHEWMVLAIQKIYKHIYIKYIQGYIK